MDEQEKIESSDKWEIDQKVLVINVGVLLKYFFREPCGSVVVAVVWIVR